MNAAKTIDARPKLRWYQFSLRSLLIFVSLFAVACSWFAVKMEQARKQRLGVAEIIKLGGAVIYGFCDRYPEDGSKPNVLVLLPNGCWRIERNPEPRVRSWLRNLFGDDFFDYVVSLHVSNAKMLDAVENLEHCTDLTLNGIAIDDDVAARLEKLIQLRTLYIFNPQNDSHAIDRLRKRMPECKISTE
jgi:hypothetical protein